MSQREYEATFDNIVKDVEKLELDLKELKKKLNCFCHNPFSPIFGPTCAKK